MKTFLLAGSHACNEYLRWQLATLPAVCRLAAAPAGQPETDERRGTALRFDLVITDQCPTARRFLEQDAAVLLCCPTAAFSTVKRLQTLARRRRIGFAMGHPLRCHAALARIHEILAGGVAGRPRSISVKLPCPARLWQADAPADDQAALVTAFHCADLLAWLPGESWDMANPEINSTPTGTSVRLHGNDQVLEVRIDIHDLGEIALEAECEAGRVAWTGPPGIGPDDHSAVHRQVRTGDLTHDTRLPVPPCNPVAVEVALLAAAARSPRVCAKAELTVLALRDRLCDIWR